MGMSGETESFRNARLGLCVGACISMLASSKHVYAWLHAARAFMHAKVYMHAIMYVHTYMHTCLSERSAHVYAGVIVCYVL